VNRTKLIDARIVIVCKTPSDAPSCVRQRSRVRRAVATEREMMRLARDERSARFDAPCGIASQSSVRMRATDARHHASQERLPSDAHCSKTAQNAAFLVRTQRRGVEIAQGFAKR